MHPEKRRAVATFVSLGLAVVASDTSAALPDRNDKPLSLQTLQHMLREGIVTIDSIGLQSTGVDGSHAIQTAQSACGRNLVIYSQGGGLKCVKQGTFAQ